MAFADPQAFDILGGTAVSFARTGFGLDTGTFHNGVSIADTDIKLTFAHAYNKRVRRSVRLDILKTAPDSLDPALNAPYSAACYLVLDVPKVGFEIADQESVVNALCAYLRASSGAAIVKFVGGEA